MSPLVTLGVGGTSSIFVKPLLDRLTFCTSFGKVDLLGVKAVATLLADLRIVFLTSHDRFLARYQRTEDATTRMSGNIPAGLLIRKYVLPKITTQTTTMMMAITPPLEMVMVPELGPAAPSSLSPVLEPADEPASPAEGPLPGWMGAEVASALKYEATDDEDMAGLIEIDVVAAAGAVDIESCAMIFKAKKFSIKLSRNKIFMSKEDVHQYMSQSIFNETLASARKCDSDGKFANIETRRCDEKCDSTCGI